MQCKIQKQNLNRLTCNYAQATLRLNGKVWPESVQKLFENFAVSKSIDELKIFVRHIALRSSLGEQRLPSLGRNKKYD